MSDNEVSKVPNGQVCYVEIPAMDISTSASFYQKVFNWNIRIRSDGSIAFDDGIGKVSGTWKLGRLAATDPGIMMSIMVDDVAETTEKIITHGCKMVKVVSMPEGQYASWFSDPGGNVIGIYQHAGGGHGKICYLEIPAENTDRAADFYAAVFGWPLREDHDGTAFDDITGNVSGVWTSQVKPSPSGLIIYVMVDSVADTLKTIVANGGKIIQPPRGNSKEDEAVFSDPAGNIMGIGQE